MMDAKQIMKRSLWVIIPLIVVGFIYLVVTAFGGVNSFDGEKRFADATLNDLVLMLIVHATLVGLLSRK
jgi:hypothetical protein